MEELFIPGVREIKHVVGDEAQRERTHPTFFSLAEQWERYIQQAQRLPRRHILVQLPERRGVRRLRTIDIPDAALSSEELKRLKRDLARQSGASCQAMEQAIARRQADRQVSEIGYYEPLEENVT